MAHVRSPCAKDLVLSALAIAIAVASVFLFCFKVFPHRSSTGRYVEVDVFSSQAEGFVGPENLGKALEGADLVVIPAGVPRKPGTCGFPSLCRTVSPP